MEGRRVRLVVAGRSGLLVRERSLDYIAKRSPLAITHLPASCRRGKSKGRRKGSPKNEPHVAI